jgi:hypothetical protein
MNNKRNRNQGISFRILLQNGDIVERVAVRRRLMDQMESMKLFPAKIHG